MTVSRPTQPYPDPSWWGWGDASLVPMLSDAVLAILRDGLGVEGGASGPPPAVQAEELPPSRLSDADLQSLVGVAGARYVRSDPQARVLHTRGKSTPDLLLARAHEVSAAPDAVVLPGGEDAVLDVLRLCSERRIAVVPFGGGTSVVGGLEPSLEGYAGLVALDVRRMNALVALDEESRVAVVEPGLRGPEAEALLAERGYTLGHFPQSFEYATLGGFAAARSSGQASAGYGRFDELVVGLRIVTPAGTLELGRAPKSAAGPDLRQLVLGSEGAFGVITSLRLEVAPAPQARVYDGWRFESFAAGAAALRALAQDGPRPTVLRLSDEAETMHMNIGRPGQPGGIELGGCLAITGFEGSSQEVDERRQGASAVLREAAADPVPGAGEAWEQGRYGAPYLRDALLGAGALVETLETASFWSGVPRVYEAVGTALRDTLTAGGTPAVVMCHISHVYPTGASLYFTVVCAQAEDPVGQWRKAKAAASEAILAAGATITHHHGVGTDHAPWLTGEIGPLGVEILRAIKAAVDPAGIMNPGVLIPLR